MDLIGEIFNFEDILLILVSHGECEDVSLNTMRKSDLLLLSDCLGTLQINADRLQRIIQAKINCVE